MGSAFHQLCPRYSGTLTPPPQLPLQLFDYGKPLAFIVYQEYISYVRPLMEYSSTVWDRCTNQDRDAAEKLQMMLRA